ncbi:MAG: hypothetical protein RIE52_00035 [Balneola sp.]|jgi:hypothetical protein
MYELEFKSHDELEILEVVATGKLNLESAIEISSKSREKAHNLGYQLLKDLSKVELDGGILQVMEFFDPKKNEKLNIKHKSVIAALFVEGSKLDYWKFWETVASNNGLISKIFVDKEKALKWLQNKAEEKQK